VVLAFGVRPALRNARSAPSSKSKASGKKEEPKELAGNQPAAPPVLAPPEPAEFDPERVRNLEIFNQVTEHLKLEPTQSSRLLQSWIHSE
jgi:flagellar M-ring protein FliF